MSGLSDAERDRYLIDMEAGGWEYAAERLIKAARDAALAPIEAVLAEMREHGDPTTRLYYGSKLSDAIRDARGGA